MREILFKAKRIDTGEWVEGYYVYDYKRNTHLILANVLVCPNCINDRKEDFSLQDYEVDLKTICRYTGSTDKNKNKIWENDIVKLILPDGEVRYLQVAFKKITREVLCLPEYDEDVVKVELNTICFIWNGDNLLPCIDENGTSDVAKMEVVGNIFDNPELLTTSEFSFRKGE